MKGGKMRYLFCDNCQKNSGYKRAFGWGTFFAVILTAGFWFLVMPFYPLRCMNCGNKFSEEGVENAGNSLESLARRMKAHRKHKNN